MGADLAAGARSIAWWCLQQPIDSCSVEEYDQFSSKKIDEYGSEDGHKENEILVDRVSRDQKRAEGRSKDVGDTGDAEKKAEFHPPVVSPRLKDPAPVEEVTDEVRQNECNGKGPKEIRFLHSFVKVRCDV